MNGLFASFFMPELNTSPEFIDAKYGSDGDGDDGYFSFSRKAMFLMSTDDLHMKDTDTLAFGSVAAKLDKFDALSNFQVHEKVEEIIDSLSDKYDGV